MGLFSDRVRGVRRSSFLLVAALLLGAGGPACRDDGGADQEYPGLSGPGSLERFELFGLFEPQWPKGYRMRLDDRVRTRSEESGFGETSILAVGVYEDGRRLGPQASSRREVLQEGGGRNARVGGFLYFSASDDSDPNHNGRRYEVEVRVLRGAERSYETLPVPDPFLAINARILGRRHDPDVSAPAEGAPRIIFLYVIDAMRAELPWAEHDGEPLMPALRRFADEAVVFERAYSASGFTRISVSSLFSGLFGCRTGVMGAIASVRPFGGLLLQSLDHRFDTLAERLADKGYGTHSHVFTPHTRLGDGMMQGFDDVAPPIATSGPLVLPKRLEGRHLFYEHILGVHGPYQPGPTDRARLGLELGDEVPRPDGTDWYSAELDANYGETLKRWYLGEAPAADRAFAERREDLERLGAWDDALVIVSADHGEAFLEHGLTGHASALYEENVQVPLMIKFPRASRFASWHGRRVSQRVRHVDLMPTVLELVGDSPLPYPVDGRSLLPILRGVETDPEGREVLLRQAVLNPVAGGLEVTAFDAIISGGLKAHFGYRPVSSQLPSSFDFAAGEFFAELYDLAEDPHETRNLAGERRGDLLRLLDRRNELCVTLGTEGALDATVQGASALQGESLLDRLRELGYVD